MNNDISHEVGFVKLVLFEPLVDAVTNKVGAIGDTAKDCDLGDGRRGSALDNACGKTGKVGGCANASNTHFSLVGQFNLFDFTNSFHNVCINNYKKVLLILSLF